MCDPSSRIKQIANIEAVLHDSFTNYMPRKGQGVFLFVAKFRHGDIDRCESDSRLSRLPEPVVRPALGL